jgi:hypothetical protein
VTAATTADRGSDDPMPVAYAEAPPSDATGGTVSAWSTDDHGISASVSSAGPSLLVASFNAAPGWTVTVDGDPAHVVEPDGALLGVQVPGGTHRVRFEYFPPGLRSGAALSLLGVLACVVVLLWPRIAGRVRRRRSASDGHASDSHA